MKFVLRKQYLNYLAIDLLEQLGNSTPQQKEIDLLESILTKVSVNQQIIFTHILTPQEASCLYWAAMGKTSKETATLLDIRTSTVEQYRKNIKRKLECKSMAEAVFRGMQLGYVQSQILDKVG